jgi:hypothetical protein
VVVALLLLVVSVLVLAACLQQARTEGWKAPGLKLRRAPRPLPAPPPEDQPPAGLTPLVPSPRAIASEFERGLRDLTLFLAVQRPD